MLLFRLALYVIVGCVALLAYVRLVERRALFAPYRDVEHTPDEEGLRYEDVYFKTEDGVALNGWFIPAGKKDAATMVFMHGNAGNISHRLRKLALFHSLGFSVFIFDYRGYGRSCGRPTEQGIYADARGAYDYVLTRRDVDAGRIVFYGASLGGAVAVDTAVHRRAAALILDSTFSSGADMARRMVPMAPAWLLSVQLDSIAKIPQLRMPKLFFHSRSDEVVPFALGERLFSAAKEPKQFVELIGTHVSGHEEDREKFGQSIVDFLTAYGVIPDRQ